MEPRRKPGYKKDSPDNAQNFKIFLIHQRLMGIWQTHAYSLQAVMMANNVKHNDMGGLIQGVRKSTYAIIFE